MIRAREDRLFERFRRTGDTGALAEVFDRTATELWRVASHLAHDQDLAADAVQGTFLRAIEDAASWDRTRPVVPWLLGILTNQVRGLRRTRARTPDPERLPRQRTTDPAQAAAEAELDTRLRSAIGGVPAPYREVVERHLLLGKGASEIAAELGIRQGTARMRLHRGLSWLRRTLQPGFASFGVVALRIDPGQLGAVRTAVLTQRTLAGVAVTPAGAGLGVLTLLGGLIVNKTLWGAAGAVVLALAGWWTWSELNGPPLADPIAREPAAPATSPLVAAVPLAAPTTSSPELTEPAPRRLAAPATETRRGKVRVRVTHAATREPVAGAHIEWRGRHYNYGVTDAAGEWVVEDVAGGATFELRYLKHRQQCQVEPERETLVRVELPVRVHVELRVLDEKRDPIAGARVFGKVREGHIRCELLGYTDREGRFEHASLFAGPQMFAEADGFVPSELIDSGDERATRLTRTVTLSRGAGTVRGRVVDADGQGVAGALVAIHGRATRRHGTETNSFVRTDSNGRFACHCVPPGRARLFALHDRRPEHGTGFLVARRAARGEAEVVAGAAADCELRLASATVNVTLAGARPKREHAWVRAELNEPELDRNLRNEVTRGSALDAAGRAVLEDILPGRYRLTLSCANRVVTGDVDLVDGQTFAWSPALEAPRDLRVRLVDDRDGPLADLRVRLEGSHDRVLTTVTDAAGRGTFHGIAGDTFQVAVSYPGEDHEAARFTGVQPLATEQVLRLAGEQRPGSLTGQLTSEAGPLPDGLRVEIHRFTGGQDDANVQYTTVTPAAGSRFTVPNVRPGTYLLVIRLREAVVAATPRLTLAPGAACDFGPVSIRAFGKLEVDARGAGAIREQLVLAVRFEGRFREVHNAPDAPLGMDPIPAGSWELLLWGENVAPATTTATVASGATSRVEMSLTGAVPCTFRFDELQQRAMHTLTVRDSGGCEVVSVVINPPRGGELRRGLPAGSYLLELEDFGTKTRVRRSLEVIPGQPATVSFAER